jgi:hypothetical protein
MTQKQFSYILKDIKTRQRTVGKQKRHQSTESRNDAKKKIGMSKTVFYEK